MSDTIKLKRDGAEFEGNLICYFQNTTSSKKYVFYTKPDEDASTSPTIKIHVALITQPDVTLNTPINNNEEWDSIKAIMGNVLKGTANPDISYLKTAETLEIADEKIIGMPSSYDYVAKHKAVYTNEAKEDVAPAVAPAEQAAAPSTEPAVATPIIPDAPEVQAEEPSAERPVTDASEPAAAPGTDSSAENPATPAGIADVNPIQSLIPDAPGEAQSPEDKSLPTIPEAPQAPEPAVNENIQIPPVPTSSEPIVPEVSTSTGLTEEEINSKFDNIITEINELREEALKLVKPASMEPIAATVVPEAPEAPTPITPDVATPSSPNDVSITPITPAAPATDAASSADASSSAGEEQNWFDMPN